MQKQQTRFVGALRPGWVTLGGIVITLTALLVLSAIFGFPSSANAGGSVSGVVLNPSGGAISGTLEVCFFGPSGGNCSTTQSDGTFSLSLNAGNFKTQTRVPASLGFGPAPEQEIAVFDGQTTSGVTLQLSVLQMKGTLKKQDGSAIQGGVNVHSSDWSRSAHADVGSDGAYTIGGLEPGVYIAEAFTHSNVSGVIAPDASEVTLSNSTVLEKDFVFLPAAKTLAGVVKRANGSPVANVCVNTNKLTGQGFAFSQTNSAGEFTLSLSGGSWMVQVHPCEQNADWMYIGSPLQVDFAPDTTTESKSITISVVTASATIAGTVRDQNGTAVSTGDIDIRNATGVGTHATLGSGGVFSARVIPGTYELRFWSSGNTYTLPPTSVSIGENETKTLSLAVKAKTAHIKGCIKTSAGENAVNVPINAFEMTGPGGGPGGFGNARTAADCTFDILVSAGKYGVHIGQEPGSNYVPVTQGPPTEVLIESDTSTVTGINFTVAKADATIVGSFKANGQTINNIPGCAFARPAGSFGESCSPIDGRTGQFTIKVSTSQGTTWEVGAHFPPNVGYSSGTPAKVTVTSGATVTQDIELLANNSSIGGRLFDSSGFPLSSCEKLKGGMIFADGNNNHYQGEIQSNCSYSISLVAGVYHIGAFYPPDSGALNSPPGAPVQVFSGQTVEKNIQFVSADASVSVTLLDQNGVGTQGYIMIDNSNEIHQSREGGPQGGPGGPQGGPDGPKKGADLGFAKNGPCGAKDVGGVIKCCQNNANKKACVDFAIPDGPNGCRNAWECVQLCKKDKSICEDADKGNRDSGPRPGENFTGPGGCKSETACREYCSKPANQTECAKFKPPSGSSAKVRISSRADAIRFSSVSAQGTEPNEGAFKNIIHSGGQTDFKGKAKIGVLSGHKYKVCAGLPPESTGMPPKCQEIDLTTAKTASVVLRLRTADATVTGTVKRDGGAADRCFVHAWAEDGSFSGQPCSANGKYTINVTCNTTWHIGADSFQDTKAYRSDEANKVIACGTKKYTQDLQLKEQDFEIPHPVSSSGTCSDSITLSLSNGTKLSVPGGAISDSTDGTCTVTATPTIELVSTKSNQLEGVGYSIKALDENNAGVSKLNSSATFTIPYDVPKSKEGSDYESGLKAVFYDSTLGAYNNLSNCTQDTTDNTFSCRVDHFSAYAISNASGTSGSSSSLKTITTAVSKKGIPNFTVNGKKVTPFSCKGTLSVVTKSVGSTQYIAVATSCDGAVKIYTAKPKLVKTIKTGFSGINTMAAGDVTKDGKADILVAPTSGTSVKVIQLTKAFTTSTVTVSGRAAQLTVSAIDFSSNGIPSMVAGTVVNGTAQSLQVFKFAKNKFSPTVSAYSGFLKGTNGVISLSVPTAKISSLSAKSVAKSNTKAKFTIKGSNFSPDSTVLVGTIGANVTYVSSTELTVKFDATKLGAGSYTVRVTGLGGKTTTAKTKVQVK